LDDCLSFLCIQEIDEYIPKAGREQSGAPFKWCGRVESKTESRLEEEQLYRYRTASGSDRIIYHFPFDIFHSPFVSPFSDTKRRHLRKSLTLPTMTNAKSLLSQRLLARCP
jgi:hypothetical protein